MSRRLNAGDLNRRITFLEATETRNSKGETLKSFAPIATNPTVFAAVKILPLAASASEVAAATHTTQSTIEAEFLVRYRADIRPKMHLQYDGREYDIHSADQDTRYDNKVALRIVARSVA
jgi:SPP1 family predicted phage head-tail adaptor